MGVVKLLHEELSYKIRGILFTVHNYLGSYRNEKQYCDGIARGFDIKIVPYEREVILPSSFPGEKPGRNKLDFLVANLVIIEVKAVPRLSRNDYQQCMRYLVSSGKDLCLLVNFYPDNLYIKRILNPNLL
ncbi:MAG: GxxExxY protein [Patescibacteria group bacterium]